MRLLLKPFKLIFKILVGILIIPAIILALIYKPIKVPKEDYSSQTVTLEGKVTESVDNFLEKDVDRDPLSFTLDSSVANNEIRKQLIEQLNSSTSSDLDYVYQDGRVLFQGAWIDYKEDTLNINAGVHIDLGLFKFKTSILLRFVVLDTDGIIELKLTKLNIGRIPLAGATSFASNIAKKTAGIDIEQMVQELVGSMGEFNMKERSLKIDLRKIAEEDEANKELISMLIDLIYSEELINFGIKTHGDEFALGLYLNLEKIEDKLAALTIAPGDRITTDTELESFLEGIIGLDNNGILSTLLTTKPEVRLSELQINQTLNYFLSSSLGSSSNGVMQEMALYEDYKVVILTPYLSLSDDIASLNLPVRFSKIGGNEFMTTLKLGVDMTVSGKDLILEIKKLDFGDLSIEASYIEKVMEFFSSGDSIGGMAISGTKLELKNFADNFENVGLIFNDLKIDSGSLVLEYSIPFVTDALTEIKDSLELNLPQEIKDQINDVIDNPSEDAVNDLITGIEGLTPAEQDAIYGAFKDAFDNSSP